MRWGKGEGGEEPDEFFKKGTGNKNF